MHRTVRPHEAETITMQIQTPAYQTVTPTARSSLHAIPQTARAS